MAANEETKQALRDAIAADYESDAAVDAAAEDVLALVGDTSEEPLNDVEEAVVEVIRNKGLAETFGEDALVMELEDLGYTVTSP